MRAARWESDAPPSRELLPGFCNARAAIRSLEFLGFPGISWDFLGFPGFLGIDFGLDFGLILGLIWVDFVLILI